MRKFEEEGCVINDLLVEDEDEENIENKVNTFEDAVKELGQTLFKRYPKKTSNLSPKQIKGMIRAEVLNDYMERNFGYRYQAIDTLIDQKLTLEVSNNAKGITSLIELMKNIQTSFEQTQIPEGMRGLIKR